MSKTKFTIKLTGREFILGDSIRPRRSDLIGVLVALEKMDMARFLWPTQKERVNSASLATIEQMVPETLANARFLHKPIEPIKACLWIVAWYNHIWLGGVRPNSGRRSIRIVTVAPAKFRCPMCGEPYFVPQKFKNQDAAIRSFSKWLVTHSRVKYHKNKPTGRLPRKFGPESSYKDKRLRVKKKRDLPRPPDPDVLDLLRAFQTEGVNKK